MIDSTLSTPPDSQDLSLVKVYAKATVLAVLFVLVTAAVFLVTGFAIVYPKYRAFSVSSGLTFSQLSDYYSLSKNDPLGVRNRPQTFLVLGTDSVSNKPNAPELTDTIMLIRYSPDENSVKLMSIPRDLWSEDYKTKYNALYHYGKDRYPDNPSQFPKEVIEQTFEQPIDYTLVLSLQDVADVVELLGGIKVTVQEAFVDSEFPRSDITPEETANPSLAYKTISFSEGTQQMSGERVLEYIRSRKSSDESQGTDDARTNRQQDVIVAIQSKLTPDYFWNNPTVAGELYQWYTGRFSKSIPLETVLPLAWGTMQHSSPLEVSRVELPIAHDNSASLINHPDPRQYQGQWVYVITDTDAMREFVKAEL